MHATSSPAVRHFLALTDLSLAEARRVLSVARRLKSEPKGARLDVLRGRAVAVVLEKASTRTRVSFEVGIAQLGGQPVVVGAGSQLGRGEPVKDTARVLGRYCDAIAFRTSQTARLVDMTAGGVPVINALSDDGHPVQVLSDIFTIEEQLEPAPRNVSDVHVAFVGDTSSNMARSWVEAASLFGFRLSLGGPSSHRPSAAEMDRARKYVTVHEDAPAAVAGADVVNTDVWTSMGQEAEGELRRAAFAGFRVDESLMRKAKPNALVLHCLPAHRGEEIDEETLEGPRSRVWDQAENRLHVQKALLLFLLGLDGQVLGS